MTHSPRPADRRRWGAAATAVALLVAVVLPTAGGCNAIFGVDDYSIDDGSTGDGGHGEGGAGAGTTCAANEVQPCYEGLPDTLGVGTCAEGTMICREDGSGFYACEGQTLPTVDDCNTTEDEDCNDLACGEVIWSRTVSDSGGPAPQRVLSVDGNDDVVVIAGTFVDALRIGGTPLVGDGTEDGFVAMLDTQGNLSWLLHLGGATQQRPTAIRLDGAGHIYVAGSFHTELVVDDTTYAGSATTWSGFVMQLDLAGNPTWVQPLLSSGDLTASALAVTAGRVAVVGSFAGDANFAGLTGTALASTDGYALTLDAAGDSQWVAQESASGTLHASAVALDDNHVFVGGNLTGAGVVGGSAIDTGTDTDCVIVRYDNAGASTSVLHLPGAGTCETTALAARNGSLVVGGTFDGTLDLGDGPRAANGLDSFVAHFDAALGTLAWGRSFGGAGNQLIHDLRSDSALELILVGGFDSALVVDTKTLASSGGMDAFVVRLDKDGLTRHVATYGGASDATARAVGLRPLSREAYVGGEFAGAISFGSATHTAQNDDGFLVRLGP